MNTCVVCSTPYAPVSDDSSPAHPSCEPTDRGRYEAATSGPRIYRGRMTALLDAGCRGCGGRVAVGDEVVLADVDGTRAWVHAACSTEAGPQIAHTGPAPVPAIPAPRAVSGELGASAGQIPAPRTTDRPTAPRRAA